MPDAFKRAPEMGKTKVPTFFYRKPFAGIYYPRAKALPVNREQMLGAMMCTWGQSQSMELSMLRRRLAAMSERIWQPGAGKSFADFRARLDFQDDRLEAILAGARQASREEGHGLTPFAGTLRVSDVLPSQNLRAMEFPDRVRLSSRKFPGSFCDMHPALAAAGNGLLIFACRIACDGPMRLAVCLGYDGPVKAWFDGRQIFLDPDGFNPASPEKAVIPLTVEKGEHEVRVALEANGGEAWGIYLRFQRLDRADLLPELLG